MKTTGTFAILQLC